jgi:FG-GAP repeat
MSRDLQGPSANIGSINRVIALTEGGTGASSLSEAVSNLNAVSKSLINKPNGIAGIGPDGKLPSSLLGFGLATIKGSTLVNTSQVSVYTITNFDSSVNYNLRAVSGSVVRSGDTITYTAPSTACVSGFTINGYLFEIDVGQVFISKPTIQSPIHLSINLNSAINFLSNDIKVAVGTDNHVSSMWELSEDINFHNIVATSGVSSVYKTTWSVTGLLENRIYYARVKYTGASYGQSNWSDTLQFKTKVVFVPSETAEIVYPGTSKFGSTVAVSEDGKRLIISDVNQLGLGSVYSYTKVPVGWALDGRIVSNDSAVGDLFGKSLGLSSDGSKLIVGSPGNKAAYLFAFANGVWTQNSKIVSTDATAQSKFGWSVALSSDGVKAAIGDTNALSDQGAVYVFNKTTGIWVQESKLVTGDLEPLQRLGWSVSMSGNGSSVVSGAYKSNLSLPSAVYCFAKNTTGWALESRLVSNDNISGDAFGTSLDLTADGNTLVVGAPGTLGTGVTGSVYLFSKLTGSWQFVRKEISTDSMTDDCFGYSVTINNAGDKVYAGSPNDDTGVFQNRGSVYMFGSGPVVKLQTSDGKAGDVFGSSMAVDGSGMCLAVGASLSDSLITTDQGSVYIFE